MNVSPVSNPSQVQSAVAKPSSEAAESWGPDNDGDADDTALTVKSFAGQTAGRPAGGGALYL